MRLLGWELKKIVNPGIVTAVVLLGVVYYMIFPQFYIRYFCNGANAEAEFALSAEWVAEYGVTIDASEREELEFQLAKELEDFQNALLMIPEASEAGVTDYDSFGAYSERYFAQIEEAGNVADMEQEQFRWRIMNGTNFFRVQALKSFIASYDRIVDDMIVDDMIVDDMIVDDMLVDNMIADDMIADAAPEGYTDAMRRRSHDLMHSEQRYGFLPTCVYDSTREYGKDLAVWCVLSIVLLLSPVLVRDRLCRTRPLQWASCRGRAVLRTQMAASCVVAFAVTMVNLIVYGIPFLRQDPLIFKDCGLESLWYTATPWFDWTYGTYLLVLAGLIVVLSMAAALMTVFLSQYSGNYIPMLLKALPLFVVTGAMAGSWMLDSSFYFRNLWQGAQMWGFCGMEAVTALFLLLTGIGVCASAAVRQRRADLL